MAGTDIRRSINVGLLFGLIALSVSAIGMVETFDEKDIISDVLSLGQLLLFVAPVLAGYVVARTKEGDLKTGPAIVSGLVASSGQCFASVDRDLNVWAGVSTSW